MKSVAHLLSILEHVLNIKNDAIKQYELHD
jgi:hypothetical protein